MKFLTTIPANKKAEIKEMFNGFNADYSDERHTFVMKGANILVVRDGIQEKNATWGVVCCKCGWISILPGETDYENCPDCGKGWVK